MALDESEKKDGQNLMVIVALKLLAAFILLGGGTVNVMRLDLSNHYEHVAGSLLSIVFLLGAGGFLIFSALKNLKKQHPALDTKKTAGIGLGLFALLLALAFGLSGPQKYGMLCKDYDDAQIAVRYKYSSFDAEFSARIEGKWKRVGAERLRKYGGFANEKSVYLVLTHDEKEGSRTNILFDFLTLEHITVGERWDGKWIEDYRLVYECRPMDLF